MSYDDTQRLPGDPAWCRAFHSEPDDHEHWTDLDGTLGDLVVVNLVEGEAPTVRLTDLPHPAADFTADEARQLAMRLWRAADFADRVAQPDVAELVERAVAEALAAQRPDATVHQLDERRTAGTAVAA